MCVCVFEMQLQRRWHTHRVKERAKERERAILLLQWLQRKGWARMKPGASSAFLLGSKGPQSWVIFYHIPGHISGSEVKELGTLSLFRLQRFWVWSPSRLPDRPVPWPCLSTESWAHGRHVALAWPVCASSRAVVSLVQPHSQVTLEVRRMSHRILGLTSHLQPPVFFSLMIWLDWKIDSGFCLNIWSKGLL